MIACISALALRPFILFVLLEFAWSALVIQGLGVNLPLPRVGDQALHGYGAMPFEPFDDYGPLGGCVGLNMNIGAS
jgi:hypothetical protein